LQPTVPRATSARAKTIRFIVTPVEEFGSP
jgi:hypothetical protein